MKTIRFFGILLFLLLSTIFCRAADYTTFINAERGFVEVTATSDILADASYYYLLTPAETNELIVGIGCYEAKPDWASGESKALRYKSAATDPVLDLTNFFTIEKSGQYIGLRNVVYSTDLFQTHDNAGFMYVNTYTDKNLDEWSYLTPTYQNGYWLFESGKYPMSSGNWACGYLGPWNKNVAEGEPIALNRQNITDDEAGHYRLWRIAKADLKMEWANLYEAASATNMIDATWAIANPSFELGDFRGWTFAAYDDQNQAFTEYNDVKISDSYPMSNKDGNYLMNAYQWWCTSMNISQTVPYLPSGEYQLSAVVCTWEGRTVSFSGNGVSVVTNGVNDQTGIPVSLTVTVGNDQRLAIKAESTGRWWESGHNGETQTFFKLDNVQLKCRSLWLNALAQPLPNDDTTLLLPGFWYYYDVSYSSDYRLIGNISDMVYSTDSNVPLANITTQDVAREMTLNKGRVYFKTTRSDATLSLHPARQVEEGTFTAVALNVDGLPKELDFGITTISLNPDGPGREGTQKISQYLASKGYDFIGCSEDFNYHGSLISSLQDNYSWGKERASLSVSGLSLNMILNGFRFDTDGLNLIWKNSTVSATNETWTPWTSMVSTDGNQYVQKGYRHYDMTLGSNGPVIDVYVLHMDAGDVNATSSRESQWQQLAAAINSADASRPKLIIGDTNSRWTREDITTNFMNRLNSNLAASDVWVEFYRNGVYPTTDMGDLTNQSDPTNYTNYEIVDKIIYINPTAVNTVQLVPLSFRIEQDYTYDYVDHDGNTNPLGDHRPVVVTFKYLVPGDVVPTDVTLLDAADNTTAISNADGVLANVTLQGRTLYKDNGWNTICLPFSMTAQQVTEQLAPDGLMELDVTDKWSMVNGQWSISSEGKQTGFDATDGTLYLCFKDANSIQAGKPYIVKWENAGSETWTDPVFYGVTITSASPDATAVSSDNSVQFCGTYQHISYATDNNSVLILGAGNALRYPRAGAALGAFRAYFQLNGITVTDINNARMFFPGDVVVAIPNAPRPTLQSARSNWYTLDGRKLDGEPLKKGIYI